MGGHYERGIYQQLEEQMLENERIREENKQLRAESRRAVTDLRRLQTIGKRARRSKDGNLDTKGTGSIYRKIWKSW